MSEPASTSTCLEPVGPGFVLVPELRARPGRAEQVLVLLRELAVLSRGEPGCRQYRVHRDEEDETTFVLYEEWEDEAAWRRHDTGARVGDLLSALAPDLREPVHVRRLLPV
ncbi:putative quinol monooxygenase [Kineococcus rubinsiae]|uniref:putative quinol monooxygenase n=1 Tax=Kineococcus rubinsiae TaxID=2609562 RepID=UPI001AD8D1D1|nr:putative quinol monooxygenase [Kineococcus rubinsiae]